MSDTILFFLRLQILLFFLNILKSYLTSRCTHSTKQVLLRHGYCISLPESIASGHAPSVRSHRGTYTSVFPDFQPMKVSEEPVCIYLFRQNPVFTSLHLRSPVHVVPPISQHQYPGVRRKSKFFSFNFRQR